MTTGRTWKNVNSSDAEEIKEYLLKKGGVEEEVKAPYEEWRIRQILPLLTTRKELFIVHPQTQGIRQYSMRGNI